LYQADAKRYSGAGEARSVDVARAEACDMMGERQQALAFEERHL